MIKKKYFIICFSFLLVLLLGSSSISLGFTVSEFETYINQATTKYLTYFTNDANSGHVPTFKSFIESTYWANNKNSYTSVFADYNSFMLVTSADSSVISVNIWLFNDKDFNITFANSTRPIKDNGGNFSLSYINPNPNSSQKRYRFYTSRNNLNNFSLNNTWNSNFDTNVQCDKAILYTTGNITNTNNYVFFGGKINVYNPLSFQQNFTNTTVYKGYTTHYTIGNIYIVNQVMLGKVIPNDAIWWNLRFIDTTSNIIIGSYSKGGVDNNAIHGNGNDIYLNTRYLSYDTVYKIEIEYIYEIGGTTNYYSGYFSLFPQGSVVNSSRGYFFN